MRFLKVSIVILFLLSLLTAGVTFYLSTIRENEKEKRVYLEGVKAELEDQVSTLEYEKSQFERKATDLEGQKKDLTKKLKDETEAHRQTQATIREKDFQIESLREEAQEAAEAFKQAEERNRELERILDELEARMRQLETQNVLPPSEAGYVQVSVSPVRPVSNSPTQTGSLETTASQAQPSDEKATEITAPKPLTALPTPPKRRKFFPFLRRQAEPEPAAQPVASDVSRTVPETTVPAIQRQEAPVRVPSPVKEMRETAREEEPKAVVPRKADQTIAAGSVLLVNRKYNFLVTNLGSRQGLSLDDVLTIQQNGDTIAKARVEKLYDDFCAAYIIEERSDRPIGEGDMVTAA